MAKFSSIKLSKIENRHGYAFMCPGCNCMHSVQTNPQFKPCWGFNGNLNKPTVNPSVLVRSNYVDQEPKTVCHSFIRDGNIKFLEDSTHELAGQTVEIPEWE